MTELEINSVIGKYGRGEPAQWQKCSRLLSEDGTQQCNHDYFYKGQKPWKKKVCRDMMKLVKEILEGNSSLLKVNTLDVSTAVMDKAKSFMLLSFKYKFGSHDAVIAATAIENSTKENIMYVVTSDRALRAAMKEEGVYFIVPGENDNKV